VLDGGGGEGRESKRIFGPLYNRGTAGRMAILFELGILGDPRFIVLHGCPDLLTARRGIFDAAFAKLL